MIKPTLIIFLILAGLTRYAEAGTFQGTCAGNVCTATSADLADPTNLNDAIDNHLTAGGTLKLPGGSPTWTQACIITKPITVKGAGWDSTVITASNVRAGSGHVAFQVTFAHNGHDFPFFRITDLMFQSKAGETTNPTQTGLFQTSSLLINGRIDHCKIKSTNMTVILTNNAYYVVDHCVIILGSGGNVWTGQNARPSESTGFSTSVTGAGTWNDDPYWATYRFVYFEDNVVLAGGTFGGSQTFDGSKGNRMCFRHNRSMNRVGGHGTGSGGNARGTRAVESYNNIFDSSDIIYSTANNGTENRIEQVRSGCRTTYNNLGLNRYNLGPGIYGNPAGQLERFECSLCPWGNITGSDLLDSNLSVIHLQGAPAAVGTLNITVTNNTGSTIAANQFLGGVIVKDKINGVTNTANYRASEISNNTSAANGGQLTITYTPAATGYGCSNLAFTTADHFQVRQVDVILDQPGRGKSDAMTDGSDCSGQPKITGTGTARDGTVDFPNNQCDASDDALYNWNNHSGSMGGPLLNGYSASGGGATGLHSIQSGRETHPNSSPRPNYYHWASPNPTPTAEMRVVGPDHEMYVTAANPTGSNDPGISVGTLEVYGFCYPHPNTLGASGDGAGCNASVPRFSISGSTGFIEGQAGGFVLTAIGFTGNPTFAITSGSLPGGVSLTNNGNGTATIGGTPSGGTGSGAGTPYAVHVVATYTPTTPDETAAQDITLTVTSPNHIPTVSITSPAAGQNFTGPSATIILSATANDLDGPIAKTEFYYGGSNFIGQYLASDPNQFFTWTGVTAGNYSLTAKAYDTNSPTPGVGTSNAVAISVTNPVFGTPTPPAQIIVRP